MADEVLLLKIKEALRIKHTALDGDIGDTIDAGLQDLKVHGIVHAGPDDQLILNAVKLYCRAEYTDEPVKADAYRQRYKELRDCLKVAEGYGWKDEVVAGE